MFSRHKVNAPGRMRPGWWIWLLLLLLGLWVGACNRVEEANEAAAPAETAATTAPESGDNAAAEATTVTAVPPSPTPIPPTPTPSEPLAARVNGEPIFLAAYEKELARYEQAQSDLGLTPAADYRQVVLNALIEQRLITQAAAAAGIEIGEQMVDERLAELIAEAGGEENFVAWLAANQWEEAEFRRALRAEMLTAEMRQRVTADVPTAVEQVRARYLQVDDPALAASLRQQIGDGSDFALLAEQYSLDRITAANGGDLGFFARGSLLVPAVEEAAFALEAEQVSEVITTTTESGEETYYLVQLIERDEERPLKGNMRYQFLKQTFEAWLEAQWETATIERFVNAEAEG
jgi:parvulin-like peptidyl-prolyl isomerase